MKLPSGFAFIPVKEATRYMRAIGNQTDGKFIGLIIPADDIHWLVTVDYEPSGYIKDDDAKNWNADDLLKNLKEGTEAGNKRREELGVPPIEVTHWVEAPKYDASVHHLVWAAEARLKNRDDPDPGINYNTYVLGREGYISMNLITSTSTIERDKSAAATLLAATEFNSGKRYTDVNFSTDKIAEYGLAALVGGLVIKKLGLLAIIGAFLLKFAKVIAIGAAAMGGGIFKRFRRKKDESSIESSTPPRLAAPVVDKPVTDEKPQV
jgi:uncharacterized membrane-anchored protein